jgi:D-inositol-3-phosphate glycosyltransferase
MLELGLALQALGHDPVVVCHNYEPGTEFANAGEHMEIHAVHRGPFATRSGKRAAMRSLWRDMPKVARLVPRDVEVINAHEWPALRAARLASDRYGVPFVWTRNDHTIFERAVVPQRRHEAPRSAARRLPRAVVAASDYFDARRAASIVVLDEISRDMAKRAYRRADVRVIRCGPADHFFDPPSRSHARRRLGIPDRAFLTLGVGVMNPHRRFEDLVRGAAQVRDDRLVLMIIGSDHVDPSYADFIEDLIDQAGITDRARLERRSVSENFLRDAYSAADLFVFPNDMRQSWGLAPLEALASGTPVVITPQAGVHEVLAGRPGVTVAAARSPSAVADALRRHLDGNADQDVSATRGWLLSDLTMRRYAEQMADVLAGTAA